ncbi:hypothetical protein JQM68_00480 [Oscillibacter valericigenes]|uniref:hypothetical protein n=1 Tax=Oscillibacter valericigenes TaxID=351091 RepID=UPI001F3920AB|nr:hypothetical protein [Oscillibacter valericigenes]MCF2615671.1 hypothetical protein [Oscillibacter valericigenes]
MERVREKLHSRTGASLLIALLFFLVAMTVGAVVLTAASANAGRIQKNRQEQQNYLAVASAAGLLREDITGAPCLTFIGSYRRIDTEIITYYESTNAETGEVTTWTTTEHKTEYKKDADDESASDGTGLDENSKLLTNGIVSLDDTYYATVPELCCAAPKQNLEKDLEFKENDELDIPAVKGKITIQTYGNERYTIRVQLNSQRNGVSSNVMTMVFAPKVSGPETTVSTRSWSAGDSHFTEVTTTYTTTVTWEEPVIRKGALG